MITTKSKAARYGVQFTDGKHWAEADVPPAKGGTGAGFGPHELLEASLACCINMWIRMQADQRGIPVGAVEVSVSLQRDHPEKVTYDCAVKLEGDLPEDQRAALLQAAEDCPVKRTLLKKALFRLRAVD